MEKAEEGVNYKKAKKRMNDEKSWAGNEWWIKLSREWILKKLRREWMMKKAEWADNE